MFSILKVPKFVKSVQVITRSLNFKTRNPPEPHYDRKRMLEVCKPIYMPDETPDYLKCSLNEAVINEEPHPYEVMLAEELKEKAAASKMMFIYHVNSLTNHEKFNMYRLFFIQNLYFHIYSSEVVKLAFSGTKYQTVLPLFNSSSALVFSPDLSLSKVLKLSKKITEKLLLLAGIIDDGFYSRSDLTSISQTLKRNVHGELIQQLSLPSASISNSISYQTNILSHYLTELSKGKQE